MIDRYTKIVLTVIAVSLALLALQPFYAPTPAQASDGDLMNIENYLSAIGSKVSSISSDLSSISSGRCRNPKIC